VKAYIFFLVFTLALELATALVATIHYKKYKNTKEKYFLYFLWFTFITDFFGSVIVAYCFKTNSAFIYNIYKITAFSFLLYWYYTIINNKNNIVYLIFVYLFSLAFSIAYEPFFGSVQKTNFVVGALLLVICSLIYFSEMLKSNKVFNLKIRLSFWITMGTLLFYIGIIPLILMNNYLKIQYLSFNIILAILNSILYSSYIIGFVWMKKK